MSNGTFFFDQLSYNLDSVIRAAVNIEQTKRNIVSVVGKFYDPIGYLAPVVIKYKVFMQALCEAKIGWDEQVSNSLLLCWQSLVSDLSHLRFQGHTSKSFPMKSNPTSCVATVMLHSLLMLYLLVETESGSYMRFVASKTRVTPLRKQTIPRLELLSALLLARLQYQRSSRVTLLCQIVLISQIPK